jgi:hypothetical protein
MLKKSVEWNVIERTPVMGRLLPVPRTSAGFHDFNDYERLVDASRSTDWRALLVVLLGGQAGPAMRRDDGVEVDIVETAHAATEKGA